MKSQQSIERMELDETDNKKRRKHPLKKASLFDNSISSSNKESLKIIPEK
jgi:hypothetical protein